MAITHAKVSAKSDGADTTKIRPSDWNAAHVGGMNWAGAWSNATAYAAGDVVANDGRVYICTTAHTNQEPPNVTYWAALGLLGLDSTLATLLIDQVGIGTDSPQKSLHVAGSAAGDMARLDAGLDLNPVTGPTTYTLGTPTAGGSVNDGAHYYGITYETALGETQLYTNYATVTTGSGNNTVPITVTASPDYRVTGIKLYRTAAGGGYWADLKLVATLTNTNQTYNDTTADAARTGVNQFYRENATNPQIKLGAYRALFVGLANSVYMGYQAGAAITSGGSNCCIGWNAGASLTTAAETVLVGTSCGQSANTTNSVAVGFSALRSASGGANTAIGYDALYANSSGGTNVGIGCLAGFRQTTGSYNTFVGPYTNYGGSNRALSNSVFIGYYAGAYETGNSKLFIDALDRTNETTQRTNALIYGGFNATVSSQWLYINAGDIRFGGGGSDYAKVDASGNLTFAGAAGLYPRVLNQADAPGAGTGATQLDTGELCIWTDTDDSKCYLCYNHGGTVKKAELT